MPSFDEIAEFVREETATAAKSRQQRSSSKTSEPMVTTCSSLSTITLTASPGRVFLVACPPRALSLSQPSPARSNHQSHVSQTEVLGYPSIPDHQFPKRLVEHPHQPGFRCRRPVVSWLQFMATLHTVDSPNQAIERTADRGTLHS